MIAADGRPADGRVQPPAFYQAQQGLAGVFHNLHRHARLLAQQVRDGIGQQRHGAHDGADGQAAARAAGDGIQFEPQLVDIRLDQAREAQRAQAGFGGNQPSVGAREQLHLQGLLQLAQRFAGAGLGQADLVGGGQQRAAFLNGDEQPELLGMQPRHDGIQAGGNVCHE
ncbi:hypothetical protein D3C87_1615300 [compost metagenome]